MKKSISILMLVILIINIFSPIIYAAQTEDAEIVFADDKLKEFLLQNYDSNNDQKITQEDMEQITSLYLYNLDCTSYAGLENATNLTELNLTDCTIDIETISALTKLEKLYIQNDSCILDSEKLISLTNLTELAIYCKEINNATNLYSLKNLTKLVLFIKGEDSILDLQGIDQITNLQELQIAACRFDNMSSIFNLTKLQKLSIKDWYFYNKDDAEAKLDFTGIKNVTSLTELNLDITYIDNINNMEEIFNSTQLTTLNLLITNGNSTDLTNLGNLTNLQYFNMFGKSTGTIDSWKNLKKLKDITLRLNYDSDIDFSKIDSIITEAPIENIYIENSDAITTLENITAGEELKKSFSEIIPFYSIVTDPNSLLYSDNIEIIVESEDLITVDNTNKQIIFNTSEANDYNTRIYLSSTKYYQPIEISWKVLNTGDNQTEIEFGSEIVKQYILENYDIDGDEIITAYDMAQIKYLTLPYIEYDQEEQSLKGLEYCSALEELTIQYNYKDYNYISNLTKLNLLYTNGIKDESDYNYVTKIPNLKKLTLSEIKFSSLDLTKLKNDLEELSISSYNDSLDITNIGNLTELKRLELTAKLTGNINSLSNLKKITYLTLSIREGSTIELGGLGDFINSNPIEYISINNNNINLGYVPKGEVVTKSFDEISILLDMMNDSNSILYSENIKVQATSENITIDQNNKKIILDTTQKRYTNRIYTNIWRKSQ